ncbi:MAG: acyltransferase [Lactobacillaceae bacterium]|jgi:hypothetical protein|nr:acyltransferase [Lactobacillaceae bacterium]
MSADKKQYLYGVDLMRLLFIIGVLTVHTSSIFQARFIENSVSYYILAAFHMPMHFTRFGFMFISGMVLFLNSFNKPFKTVDFWKKRFFWILIPYFSWMFIYDWITHDMGEVLTGSWWVRYGIDLLTGDGFYLYFIYVMIQLYLLFPLLRWLLKKTVNHHLMLFVITMAVQILITVFYKYFYPEMSHVGWPYFLTHYGMFVGTYEGYFIAGALAGIHYQEVENWIVQHHKKLHVSLIIGIVVITSYFFFDRFVLGLSTSKSYEVHQPLFPVYALIVIGNIFYLSTRYDALVKSGSRPKFTYFVSAVQKVAFGIYLTQTIPLRLFTWFSNGIPLDSWINWIAWPISTVLIVAMAALISWTLFNTKGLHYLVGRPIGKGYLSFIKRGEA